jgi:hypothetical protein
VCRELASLLVEGFGLFGVAVNSHGEVLSKALNIEFRRYLPTCLTCPGAA